MKLKSIHLIIVMIMLYISGCVRILGNHPVAYKKGKRWLFELKAYDATLKTTKTMEFELYIPGGTTNSGQIKSQFNTFSINKLGNKQLRMSYITGIVENREEAWIHPYFFKFLENSTMRGAPFPNVQFPVRVGNEWYGGQYPHNALFGLKSPNNHPKAHTWWHYKVESIDTFRLRTEIITTYKVIAKGALSKGGETKFKCEFYWNDSAGFVKMVYIKEQDSIECSLSRLSKL